MKDHLLFYVYQHLTEDTDRVFYIGKGSNNRAYSIHQRTRYWKNVVGKHGFKTEILAYFINEEDAFQFEKDKILEYKNLGYTLVNLTDGGEGTVGWHHKSETRSRISKAHTGKKHSQEHRRKNSEVRKGIPRSQEICDKISLTMKRLLADKPEWHKDPPRKDNFSHTDETKIKISNSLKGNIPWNKGKKGVQVAWNKGLKKKT